MSWNDQGASTTGGGYVTNGNCHTTYNPPMNHYMNMLDQTWYNDMLAANYNSIADQSSSNSREQRNKAEKMRRDKLNYYISELAGLVPLISTSPKRMDKTSILRLTATHLRIYQTLVNGNCERMNMPREIDQIVLENLVCEQLGGFLMILAGNGKVIFVSPTVENILGHLQTDLMGQSVFNVIAPDDQSRFKTYLRTDLVTESDWRKYFNLRLRRAGPRSESPVYEAIEVMGVKQVTRSHLPEAESHSRDLQAVNTDMWVFFMRLNRPEPITDQLMEASKDEYVTRHLIDGRIINCDQRISFIAGYMIEEVSGLTAFKFMHRDDVRWVMIALRQMYDKGEARGNSCYRLLSRTGQFIYLRTYGFLEIDSTGIVKSFICVNKLVTEKEGVKLITEMKQRYSPLVKSSPPQLQLTNEEATGSVEDPMELEEAIATLLSNLPSPDSETSDQTTHASSDGLRDCPSTPSAGSMSPCDTSSNASSHPPLPPPSTGKTIPKRPPSVDPTAPHKRIKIEAPVQVTSPAAYNHRQQRPFNGYTDEHR
ncbi:basic helix-loop-helix ARNT-like protein 1 isoform X1 [Atheta coriaria]|uniref:basic helix-loop-helix ARNT-like protein 1 isoform X1 n=1 Tax=Dalotia coriaria TaxID=877792 RepID=UPI0031F38BC6